MDSWKSVFWVAYFILLILYGFGWGRTGPEGRWGWGISGAALFILTAILAMGLKWNPFPSG